MHCPRCGDVMIEEGATFRYVRGEMLLTQYVANGLREAFIARNVPHKKTNSSNFPLGRDLVLPELRCSDAGGFGHQWRSVSEMQWKFGVIPLLAN
jgi:hypothetical protein